MPLLYKRNHHLERLDKILNYGIDDAVPAPFYFVPDSVGSIGILVAIVSTPVILWSLFRLKRYGWLLSFFLFIMLPYIATYYFIPNSSWNFVFVIIPLAFLSVYYFILRLTIPNWKEPIFINKPGSDFE
ncbi:hypothetical protein [Gracilimonas halophila]|uniref:Uncharacterized protein n=1 Tax=Gracilimonas halophila TaxID=1834464 RepID=A0ABW5JE94_9BACT